MVVKYQSFAEVPEPIKRKLENYVTNVGGNTFVIAGLPHEVVGGVLARYSRSPTGLQLTLVNEFLDKEGNAVQARGTALVERVLVDFGDESVGELEGAHVGLENLSQLATKWIEDRRIGGSPIEQSTRYVKYDQKDEQGRWRYLRPKEIMESGLGEKFERVNNNAFEVYQKGIQALVEYFRNKLPQERFTIKVPRSDRLVEVGLNELQGEAEKKEFRRNYEFTIRCAALDVGRCVLPAATLTHLGVYGNGRFFTNLITYLKSHELDEAQQRGVALERELSKVIPTFVKRNKRHKRYQEIDRGMRQFADYIFRNMTPTADKVTLVSRSRYQDEVIASILFPYTNISLEQILNDLKSLPQGKKAEIFQAYVGRRASRRDRTGRGFEAGYPITFDLVGGFAEYRDLERHRMLTQQRQSLTTELGFILPPEMVEVGLEKEVTEVVDLMEDLNSDIRRAGMRAAAEYATLFNHRIRFMLGMNLREFQHLAELRTGQTGHFSYRAMVMEMARKLIARDLWVEEGLEFIDYSDPDNKITRAKERSRIAGKNLAKGIQDEP